MDKNTINAAAGAITLEYRIGLHTAELLRKQINQMETDLEVHKQSHFAGISHRDYEHLVTELENTKRSLQRTEDRNQGLHDARELVFNLEG